jgi:hypothetical protein
MFAPSQASTASFYFALVYPLWPNLSLNDFLLITAGNYSDALTVAGLTFHKNISIDTMVADAAAGQIGQMTKKGR